MPSPSRKRARRIAHRQAVRLRTDPSRRFKKVDNAEAMIWKLLLVAQEGLAGAQGPSSQEGRVRPKGVQRRSCYALENHADKESRLIPFTLLFTRRRAELPRRLRPALSCLRETTMLCKL